MSGTVDITKPLVSVIMPAFNAESTLPYAIESVLSQSYTELELIVVDDSSSDATPQILTYYAKLDRRIITRRNLRNSRQGPIQWEPRNDGLRLSRGAYIAYLDADNTWEPSFIAMLLKPLLEHPHLQIAHCDSRNYYSAEEKERAVSLDHRQLVAEGETWTVFSHDVTDLGCLGKSQYVDTNEMFHRASVFADLGCRWRTVHPRCSEIGCYFGRLRSGRRHNDLDLFERIAVRFGVDATFHVKTVLVNYFYSSYRRPCHRLLAVPRNFPGGRRLVMASFLPDSSLS